MKKILSTFLSVSTLFASFAFVLPVLAASPNWDATGNYVITLEHLGSYYPHDMSLVQDELGNLTGNGGSPAGANTYLWTITAGDVSGNVITLTADYTATPDAVTPQTTMLIDGTIAPDGTLSGTWSDNYSGSERSGTWTTAAGEASPILTGTLTAQDFGVVSYDTGLGMLSGYTAGFGVTDATLAEAQSVVVELFSGTDLLQTNTAIIPKFNTDITGTQFSSPFDVSGTFDYVTDGYWTNVRAAEFGQSEPATKVVATVTLANGTVVTTTNTALVGDPTTIFEDTDSTTVTVTILKYIDGVPATGLNANNADFPMTSTWDAANIGMGSGFYTLSELNDTPYEAMTTAMTKGADYETNELVDGDVVGVQCDSGKPFALQGYSVGDTQAEAAAATSSLATPAFTNLQQDKFVIVWNNDCVLAGGQIGGEVIDNDGILEVTSIDMVDMSAIANGTFTDGWKYVFHVTAPTSEEKVAMKFNDWLRTGSEGSIPVSGNMRISSLQADNAGASILLTAANTYSTPDLVMTGDLDPVMLGRQIEITVEVAVPAGTPNGSYTTSYGVRSNP